jgi:GNAT superfamily N-acetyltransferase
MPEIPLNQTRPTHDIRTAVWNDAPELLELIRLLTEFHGDTPQASLHQLRLDLFGSPSWATALVAPKAGRLLGYAMLCRQYNAHLGTRVMELHHLFVRPEARGQGLGRALVNAASATARSAGCGVLTVGTHPDNRRAQAFYPELGFQAAAVAGPRFRMPLP